VEAFDRTGLVVSHMSENYPPLRPVVSDWSGGVGLEFGIERGIISIGIITYGIVSRHDISAVVPHRKISEG
jgi:hypothetical protein